MLSQCCLSTSPSIYVNFHGLNAGDNCGTTYISSTMIAFSREELSTIAGQPGGKGFESSQQFNAADLPCPPQSIMVGQAPEVQVLCFSNINTCSPRTGTNHCQACHIVRFSPFPKRSGRRSHFLNIVTRFGSASSTRQESWSQGWH